MEIDATVCVSVYKPDAAAVINLELAKFVAVRVGKKLSAAGANGFDEGVGVGGARLF